MDVRENDRGAPDQPVPRRPLIGRTLVGTAAILAVLVAILWTERGDIADHEIGSFLREQGIPARWHIAAIGLGQQIVTDVEVGNPAHPDLTIDRVITNTGAKGIGAVTLINPRLQGSWRGGRISFGALDKLLNRPATGAFRLPDLVLRIDNGRGRITGDAGTIGLGLSGAGPLRGGFGGTLVAVAQHLQLAGCHASAAKLSGHIGVTADRPRLTGPLQLDAVICPAGARLGGVTMALDLRAQAALDGGDGQVSLAVQRLALSAARSAAMRATAAMTLHGGVINARYTAALQGVHGGQVTATALAAEGVLRADTALAHVTAEGTLSGQGLTPDAAAWRAFAQAQRAGVGTPAAPLLERIVQVLAREAPGSRLTGRYLLHRTGSTASLIVPEAQLTGGSGASLLALTRAAVVSSAGGPRFSGHFVTGGQLPQITATLGQNTQGRDRLSLTMADYRAGTAALAVPRLDATLAAGAVGLAGAAVLSGPLPGGAAQNLRLAVAGSWTSRGLSLWPACTRIAFDRLRFASLTLLRDGLTVCPRPGGAILHSGAGGTRIAAGVPTFAVAGQLGGSPIGLTGGPLGVALMPGRPGTLTGQAVAVTLGEGEGGTSHFRLNAVTARFGQTAAGDFSGSDVDLAAVPLNLRGLGGGWQYSGGVLTIANATFRVEDRVAPARFQPLAAQDGVLTLAQGVIHARASLREPRSERAIAGLALRHDLTSGNGHAELAVDGIRFDKGLQPDALSASLLGVVADVRGTVTGNGTIDWAGGKITSQGRFASDALDFSAAFGPVKGVSGAVTFTDLLGLVSAPAQHLKIAAINPGIEVDDGVLTFALLPGHVLAVQGAQWPFLDGELRLLPTRMTLGVAEVRRYEMRVEGVDAAKFLVRLNMANLGATGRFDGSLPLVFDQVGGKVVGGMLTSRPPGGSVSYIGALSYKDLTPMANYAFETLKSLHYQQLNIGLDGSLAGEIFTRVNMRGVTQGPGAKRNFLTRQIGKLPLQFNVNIRAPFYMLVTNFKSLYDSSLLPDPRTLGLIGASGQPPHDGSATPVQPPVIENKP